MPNVVRVITRLNIGGPAQHVIHLTARLPGRGFPSTLVAGRVDPGEGDMLDLAQARGVTPRMIPSLRNAGGVVDNLRAFVALYRIFRRERPDIVHLHLLKARVLGGIAARLARVPVVVETFHGTLFTGYYGPVLTRVLIAGERWLAGRMHGIIAVSPQVAAELIRLRVAPAGEIAVIPLGLELEGFVKDGPRGALRRELSVSDDVPLVGAVGRMVPIKGLGVLLDAAARVVAADPTVMFILVGDGAERPALERQARALGITRQVRFVGWRKDLERIYADLDVVVLSSLHEGTPVSVIEAMAAGRPVVATRVGGVPDLIRDAETGLLVPPRDAAALAGSVLRLLRDQALRARLGQAARAAAYPQYSIDRLVDDVARFYARVLERRGRRHQESS